MKIHWAAETTACICGHVCSICSLLQSFMGCLVGWGALAVSCGFWLSNLWYQTEQKAPVVLAPGSLKTPTLWGYSSNKWLRVFTDRHKETSRQLVSTLFRSLFFLFPHFKSLSGNRGVGRKYIRRTTGQGSMVLCTGGVQKTQPYWRSSSLVSMEVSTSRLRLLWRMNQKKRDASLF